MFKLTTKSKYGLKACFCLAQKGDMLSVSEIAACSGVSVNYLEQLFMKLKKDGIVTATRGAGGGYNLCLKPSEITIGKIMRSLEGEIAVASCQGGECANSDTCPTKSIFSQLNIGLTALVDSITVQDMLDDYAKREIKS